MLVRHTHAFRSRCASEAFVWSIVWYFKSQSADHCSCRKRVELPGNFVSVLRIANPNGSHLSRLEIWKSSNMFVVKLCPIWAFAVPRDAFVFCVYSMSDALDAIQIPCSKSSLVIAAFYQTRRETYIDP